MTEPIERLYDQYRRERAYRSPVGGFTLSDFAGKFGERLSGMDRVTEDAGGRGGALYYTLGEEGGCRVCDTPVWGYWAEDEGTLCRLFTRLAERVLEDGDTLFRIRLYAHDTGAQRLLAMTQFGYMAERGICPIERLTELSSSGREELRTLTKEEICSRWPELWGMTGAIVRHLQRPPVCYPGAEFTEEVYREFYLDGGTALHAAFSPEGGLAGIIESNGEPDFFPGDGRRSVNVGEAYVTPERRGSGLAARLLRHAAVYERDRGAAVMWVEHGTANPNARGFWGKYFDTYQYEMDRLIRV